MTSFTEFMFTSLESNPIIPVKEPFSSRNPHWPSGGSITLYLKCESNLQLGFHTLNDLFRASCDKHACVCTKYLLESHVVCKDVHHLKKYPRIGCGIAVFVEFPCH